MCGKFEIIYGEFKKIYNEQWNIIIFISFTKK